VGDYLTCSIGIAPNKAMAKLGSDLKKPDGLVVITPAGIPEVLKKVKLTDLCGIGPRIARRLLSLGIDTPEKLGRFPVEKLVRRFGRYGYLLSQLGRGADPSPVRPYYHHDPARSIGHAYTLPKDTHDPDLVRRTLLRLCEQVGRRLRAGGYAGRTVHLVLRRPDFTTVGRQCTVDSHTDDGYRIYRVAGLILEELYSPAGVRLIGVSVGQLTQGIRQLSLLPDDRRREALNYTVDRLNDRYGEFTVARAFLLERQGGPPPIIRAWEPPSVRALD